MTKKNKTICLDEDIVEQLEKVDNYSGLINQLLKEYFGSGEGLKKKQIEEELIKVNQEIEQARLRAKLLNESLQKIEAHEEIIKRKFSKIEPEILEDFKSFTEMDEMSLRIRYKDIYSKSSLCSLPQILEAFNEWKELQK
jgi:predicted nuclease with TOPRIM domain